jgi:hypothetical protein
MGFASSSNPHLFLTQADRRLPAATPVGCHSGQSQNFHRFRPCGTQGPAALPGCRPGGENIINQTNGSSVNLLSLYHPKSTPQVFPPGNSVKSSLREGISDSDQAIKQNVFSTIGKKMRGQNGSLIQTSATEPLPMQRNRDNPPAVGKGLDVVTGYQIAQYRNYSGIPLILQ